MSQVGRYQIVRELAVGGMARVFLAKAAGPKGFQKTLVLKTILPHLTRDPQFVEMFLSEARVAAQFTHPNLVQIFELGEIQGTYFIAMEYIDGPNLRTLSKRAAARGLQLSPALCAKVIWYACEGLAYAHDFIDPETGTPLGLVHRDISPDNIILSRSGTVKVVDFGIAKGTEGAASHHTQTGVVKGKLAYMAPEVIRGEAIDRRADLFALGVVLYEMLSGCRPFRNATTDAKVMHSILFEPFVPLAERRPGVPAELVGIVERAVSKDRAKRYANCHEMQVDLEAFLARCGESATPHELAKLVGELADPAGSEAPGSGSKPSARPTPSIRATPSASLVPTAGSGVPGASAGEAPPAMGQEGRAIAAPGGEPAADAGRVSAGEVRRDEQSTPTDRPEVATSRGGPSVRSGADDLVLPEVSTGDVVLVEEPPTRSPAPPALPPRATPAARPPVAEVRASPAPARRRGRGRVVALGAAAVASMLGGAGALHLFQRTTRPAAPQVAIAPVVAPSLRPSAGSPSPAVPAAASVPVAEETGPAAAPSPSESARISAARREAEYAWVTIDSDVPARLRIDGKVAGNFPVRVRRNRPGRVHLELIDGSGTVLKAQTMRLGPGDNGTKTLHLEEGLIEFRIRPYATVFLDGKPLGQTPLTVRATEGVHRIVLVNKELEKEVRLNHVVRPNERTIVKYLFDE